MEIAAQSAATLFSFTIILSIFSLCNNSPSCLYGLHVVNELHVVTAECTVCRQVQLEGKDYECTRKLNHSSLNHFEKYLAYNSIMVIKMFLCHIMNVIWLKILEITEFLRVIPMFISHRITVYGL